MWPTELQRLLTESIYNNNFDSFSVLARRVLLIHAMGTVPCVRSSSRDILYTQNKFILGIKI
jgi:hypothetical protein